jgi:small subunit ribosomal protein S3
VIAYKMLQQIIRAGAMGVEIVLSGKLPSDRSRTWRFSHGYLKKTGDPAKVVDKAQAQAKTQLGVVGVKVSILPPNAHIHDQIIVDKNLTDKIKLSMIPQETEEEPKSPKKTSKKKSTKKGDKK